MTSLKNNQLAIILPAFDEAKVLATTLKSIRKNISSSKIKYKLVVVDDGSRDNTFKIANKHADVVLRHKINRGLGASLATGLEYARLNSYNTCVTFDSDGQHDPQDITKAIKKLQQGYQVVIGSRFLDKRTQVPMLRKIILKVSNLITFIFFGVWTSDSQSGFRAFDKTAIELIRLTTNRMEVSSEFFEQIKTHSLRFTEIPIHIKYTDYSKAKGQSNLNGVKVLLKLIIKLFR